MTKSTRETTKLKRIDFPLIKANQQKPFTADDTGSVSELDLACAFDSVSWPLLLQILRRMGFGPRFFH
jgi:hypothetical protein